MRKRLISLLLACTMVLSFVYVPSFAVEKAELTVLSIDKLGEDGEVIEGKTNVTELALNDIIAVTVGVKAGNEAIAANAYQFKLDYDSDVFELWSQSANKRNNFHNTSFSNLEIVSTAQNWPEPAENGGEEGSVVLAASNTKKVQGDYTALNATASAGESIDLIQIAFKVKATAESGRAVFSFNTKYENRVSYFYAANSEKTNPLDLVYVPVFVTINGVAPTLGKVTVTDKGNNTVLDTSNSELKFGTLEVNGTTDYTYQAHAWSTSGKEITGNVTWKFKVGNELCTEFRGATIDETTGQIFIPKDASTDVSGTTFAMSVVAQAKEGVTAEKDIETSLIQVRREEYRIAAIQISRKNNETGALIIPGTGEEAATAEFVATCTNQYGRTYEGDQTVYWNYERVGSQYGVKTVDFINTTATGATLKAEAGAADSVTDSATLKVKAYAGDINDRVYSNEVEITVQRDTVQRPAKIEVTGAGSIDIPITGEKKELYTATVKDQYGAEMSGQTVTWSVVDGNGNAQNPVGVNLNESTGALTVTSAAAGNDFTEDQNGNLVYSFDIKATCGSVSGTTTLTLTRKPATVKSIAIEGIHSVALYKVPTMDDNENFEHALTVKKTDQYGVTTEAAANEVTWDKLSVLGVTLQNGTLTIQPAAGGHEFTKDQYDNLVYSFEIKAICGGKDATKTITLTRQPSVATAIAYGTGMTNPVVPTNETPVSANVTPAVEDQYGLLMNNATVEPDGDLPVGFVWQEGSLWVTKAAVAHFGGERRASVDVNVGLRCKDSPTVRNTAEVTLELAAAQINKDSAEITGTASIAKPTGEQSNTAVYSISDVIKDQYGLRMQNVDRSKLSLKLYSDAACENEVTNGSVTLSGNTITVTKDATLDKTYYLKASYQVGNYSHMQCAPVKEITIVDKTVSNTLTVTQSDFTYGEEGKLNPVVKKGSETVTNATFVYTKGGQTVTEVKDAGKYTVTATCEDANYIYTGSVDFQILPKKILVDWIELDGTRYTYNGQQQTVQYTVMDGTTELVKDRDYTVKGDSGTDAGPYLLEITGTGNYYSDLNAAVKTSVTWNIWAATLTVTGVDIPAINYDPDFDGALNVNSVTFSGLMNGETLTKDADYTVSGFTNAENAGTHSGGAAVTVTLRETGTAKNYKFAGSTALLDGRRVVVSGDVTINKINYQAEAVSAEGKYGNQLSVDLSQHLEGGSAAVSTITDNENILDAVAGGGKAIVQNGKLWLQLADDSTKVGQRATVTLTVSSTNYNPFTITVTVTVQNKKTQTITASDLNVTYGDAGVKLNASALDNAELTYQVTDGADVITVDTNGNVTLLKSGTAEIQITAAETEDYGVGTKLVTVTVAKRSLTVKANDLTAYVGGQLPALDYTVTGLVSGDTLTVPELELKDVPAGVDPMKTAGTYTIGFKTAPEADPDKYDLTVETGTLTISSRPNVNPVPAGNSVKLEEAAGGKLTSSVSRATKGTTVTITVKPDAGYQLEELEVLGKNGESLPLKELANGKFSFQMPDSKVTVQASFVQESTYAGYPDVLPQDWFYSSVRYVTERGLMNGTPNGFEPNMDSSRATIWTILARFSGVDTTVVSGEWYAVARQWAMENGVSDGTNPNGVITREQLATMLYRFAKNKGLVQEPVTADLSVFVDAGQISDYALDAMRWAVSVGLLNGMDGSRLAPQGSAARAQVAAMLMRFDQLAK